MKPSYMLVVASLVGCSLALPFVSHASSPVVPPAMLDACKGKPDGAACSFTMSGKEISGVCAPLPEGELACRPGGKPKVKKAAPAPKP